MRRWRWGDVSLRRFDHRYILRRPACLRFWTMKACKHRRDVERIAETGDRHVKVYGCNFHGECTYGIVVDGLTNCVGCIDRDKKASEILTCVNRGTEELSRVVCNTCVGGVMIKTYPCVIHGQCTIGKEVTSIKCCNGCLDNPDAIRFGRPSKVPPTPEIGPVRFGGWTWKVRNCDVCTGHGVC